LLDTDVVAAPERDSIQLVAQARAAELHHEQFFVLQFLNRPCGEWVLALQADFGPLDTALGVRLPRYQHPLIGLRYAGRDRLVGRLPLGVGLLGLELIEVLGLA